VTALVAVAVVACAPAAPRGVAPGQTPAESAPEQTDPDPTSERIEEASADAGLAVQPSETPEPAVDASVAPVEPPPVYPFNQLSFGTALPKAAPAHEFANLSPGQCAKRLRALGKAVRRSRDVRGVATEVRLSEPLHGVRFVAPGGRSPFGVLDCRLVLAMDAFAELLAAHDVVEVRVDNFYRKRAHLPGSRKASQHAYGLAADITRFALSDGSRIVVERDWQATIGDTPCGPDARVAEPTREALTLRTVVCEAVAQGLFNHVLSPSYDAAHRDHLHMDIKRGDARRIIR
jgi:hypothetical protein